MSPMPEVDPEAWGQAVSDDLAHIAMWTDPPLRTYDYGFQFVVSDRGLVVTVTIADHDGQQVEGDDLIYQAIWVALGSIHALVRELWIELPEDRRKEVLQEVKVSSMQLSCTVIPKISAGVFSPRFAKIFAPEPVVEQVPAREMDEAALERAQAYRAAIDPSYR